MQFALPRIASITRRLVGGCFPGFDLHDETRS